MQGGLPGDQVSRLTQPKSDQRAHGSRKRPSGQGPSGQAVKRAQIPQTCRRNGQPATIQPHPQARTDLKRRTTDGVTPASSPPARAEDFTRTRPAPMSMAVKPSAQPTLVRTQHLPPPAKTARWLRKRGPAGRFLLVPPCVMVCRHRSSCSDSYGHMADSVRAEGAVRGTACFAHPRPFCPVIRARTGLADWYMPRISGGASSPFYSSWAAGWLVRTCGRAGCRIGPRHLVEVPRRR